MSTQALDFTGHSHGKLTVLSFAGWNKWRQRTWLCQCLCGNTTTLRVDQLRKTKSCGCLVSPKQENASIHRQEYPIWRGIIARCENPNVKGYPLYGGRGVKICAEWRGNFNKFLNDVGPRPSKIHSIERIDTNGDYEPGNCCWDVPLRQVNNRRNTRRVVYLGRTMPLTDAVREAGSVVHRETAWIRISRCGWSVEDAVQTPRLHESPLTKSRRLAAEKAFAGRPSVPMRRMAA